MGGFPSKRSNNATDFESVTPAAVAIAPQVAAKEVVISASGAAAPSPQPSPSLCLTGVNDFRLPTEGDVPTPTHTDFHLTEGQIRRGMLANWEIECSTITDFLFVGGIKVASSLSILEKHGITRIINCSNSAVSDCFKHMPSMKYLSLNMLDGRTEDISWFACEVLNFIHQGKLCGEKTLLHCEKGVSRSCSFAIAYQMWSTGARWKDAFEFVKSKRDICNPNTVFTCNLIELDDIFQGEVFKQQSVMFRCAAHLPHDSVTPVLKLCRSKESRAVLAPRLSLLDAKGIFVIRPATSSMDTKLYIWVGNEIEQKNVFIPSVQKLAESLKGIFAPATEIVIVHDNAETPAYPTEFLECVEQDPSPMTDCYFNDLFSLSSTIQSADVVTSKVVTAQPESEASNSVTLKLPEIATASSAAIPQLPLLVNNSKQLSLPLADKLYTNNSKEFQVQPAVVEPKQLIEVGANVEKVPSMSSLRAKSIPKLDLSSAGLGVEPIITPVRHYSTEEEEGGQSVQSSFKTNVPPLSSMPPISLPSANSNSSKALPIASDADVATNNSPLSSAIPAATVVSSSSSNAMVVNIITPQAAAPSNGGFSGSSGKESITSTPTFVARPPAGAPPSHATPTPNLTLGGRKLSLSNSNSVLDGLSATDSSVPVAIKTVVPVVTSLTLPIASTMPSATASASAQTQETANTNSDEIATKKPRLFLAEPSSTEGKPYVWENMGMYDDSDLDPTRLLLLLSPLSSNNPPYFWIGGEFSELLQLGNDVVPNWILEHVGGGEVPALQLENLVHVLRGVEPVGTLIIERCGNESDEFWDCFNEGY